MDWIQTLLVAVAPATVTAAALLLQSRAIRKESAQRIRHEAASRHYESVREAHRAATAALARVWAQAQTGQAQMAAAEEVSQVVERLQLECDADTGDKAVDYTRALAELFGENQEERKELMDRAHKTNKAFHAAMRDEQGRLLQKVQGDPG